MQPLKTKEFIASIESKAGRDRKRPGSLKLQQRQMLQKSLPGRERKEINKIISLEVWKSFLTLPPRLRQTQQSREIEAGKRTKRD